MSKSKPTTVLRITGPTFERPASWAPVTIPAPDAFEKLRVLDTDALRALGCDRWDDEGDTALMLFPVTWYDHIPAGYVLECINGKTYSFAHGETDSDRRYGMLAYGIRVPVATKGTDPS